LFIPFFDEQSQSNVVVTVCNLNGQPCPLEYTNTISNNYLFNSDQQKEIEGIFVKYRNVTTNSGPDGTVLASFYKTNTIVKAMGRSFTNKLLIAGFQYTNLDAHEEITFGHGILAEFKNRSNDGYHVSFTRTGDGTLLSYTEVKHGMINGLLARFVDIHAQGMTWDYKRASFDGNHLEEYGQRTNGLVIGKYFMWNPQNGDLVIQADFKQPYDLNKHRVNPYLSRAKQ